MITQLMRFSFQQGAGLEQYRQLVQYCNEHGQKVPRNNWNYWTDHEQTRVYRFAESDLYICKQGMQVMLLVDNKPPSELEELLNTLFGTRH